jgi:hypothetical protein
MSLKMYEVNFVQGADTIIIINRCNHLNNITNISTCSLIIRCKHLNNIPINMDRLVNIK